MSSIKHSLLSLFRVAVLSSAAAAAANDVNAGFNAYKAAQVMVNIASHSWEWGTASEALLELYDPELSVFASDPFPNGKVPNASPSTFALTYARQFINRDSQVLVGDSAVGDPASLGVSAILLGQSDNVYIGAANREAEFILVDAPRFSNGAISHRPDVAEIWADNMAMSFPFLAYLAVQQNNASLMALTFQQCGLQRDVLKAGDLNWRHIIGPQSQDTGLWSTGNGWAGYGMVRVLHTMQKWSGSRSMTSEAGQLKNWIKEILDGAMASGLDNGLLHNYLNDGSWFGEISGTSILSAVAYRMAVNDPGMFGQSYIIWADTNRKALAQKQDGNGIFRPAVNPLNWLDRNPDNNGSPEGQAFAVYLYTAYRDCVNAKVCQAPPSATTISHSGIGPIDILTVLNAPVTFSEMPDPTGVACGGAGSCDAPDCNGSFSGFTKFPVCQSAARKGCQCTATNKTCGSHQSCDLNGCAGKFTGLTQFPQCTGNFQDCECTPTNTTCGSHQSCDLNGCDGKFLTSTKFPQCTGNFQGCECTTTKKICGDRQSCELNGCEGKFNGATQYAQCSGNFQGCDCAQTPKTCGAAQRCDLNGCDGAFDLTSGKAFCTNNFAGCQCTPTPQTCGDPQSCEAGNCAGAFSGMTAFPQCTNFFKDCQCTPTKKTCGSPQDCGLNNCDGTFDLSTGKAVCTKNFVGCECAANSATCGAPQSCDLNNCDGKFTGSQPFPQCSNFFNSCQCTASDKTCGSAQSCNLNGCDGAFDSKGVARCTGNFVGCKCNPDKTTCGQPQHCDLNGCNGKFLTTQGPPTCTGKFPGCPCIPTSDTCGPKDSCDAHGCHGTFNNGNPVCTLFLFGCPCIPDPIWVPPPPKLPQSPVSVPTPPPAPSPPPTVDWTKVCQFTPTCFDNCGLSSGLLCPMFCCAVCSANQISGINCNEQ